jgi:hypothetical protein
MAPLAHATIEDEAARLLSRHADLLGASVPVDVDALAEDGEGLDVAEAPDLALVQGAPEVAAGATLSGLLLPAERRIWVNGVEAARSPGRRRFTIAHEIGHWILHAAAAPTAQTRWCRTEDVSESRTSSDVESEANRFAAALLMPRDLVLVEAERQLLNVVVLAHRFEVSEAAMRVRLTTLELLPDYMR